MKDLLEKKDIIDEIMKSLDKRVNIQRDSKSRMYEVS